MMALVFLAIVIIAYIFSSKFRSGWQLISQTNKIFFRYPLFLTPLVITWCIYAGIILYLVYFSGYRNWSTGLFFLIFFLTIFVFAFIISLSSFVMLELIQQLESQKTMDLKAAFIEGLKKDIVKAIPIIFAWTC